MSNQVFVSYAHEDAYLVNPLVRDLEYYAERVIRGDENIPELGVEFGRGNKGFTFWKDSALKAGGDWASDIDAAIEKSFAILVMLSDKSIKSPYVTYEWAYARGLGLKMFILQIEEDVEDIHPKLSATQKIFYRGNPDKWWKDILIGLDHEQVNFLSEGLGKHISILLEAARLQKEHQNYENAIATFIDVEQIATPSFRDDIWYEIADCHLLARKEHRSRADDFHKKAEKADAAGDVNERNKYLGLKEEKEIAADEARAEAREALTNALRFNEGHTKALILEGELIREEADALGERTIERKEKLESACERFERAISFNESALDDNGESVYGSLGGIYLRLGHRAKAIEAYKNAVRVRRTSYPLGNLALLFMEDNNHEEMVRYFRQVEKFARARTERTPDDKWAYNDLFLAQVVEVHNREMQGNTDFIEDAKLRAEDTLTYLELFKEYTDSRVTSSLVVTLKKMDDMQKFKPTSDDLVKRAITMLAEPGN